MENVAVEDLYRFVFVSDAAFSPDGKHIAYLRHRADRGGNCYHSALWLMDAGGENQILLAEKGEVKSFLWLDDDTLLFVSQRGEKKDPEKPATDCWAISVSGGEARPYMSLPLKAEELRPAGQDRFYVLASVPAVPEEQAQASPDEAREEKDYHIFDELPFWFNGKGFRNRIRTALFLYDRKSEALRRITEPFLDVCAWAVSPSGKRVAYAGAAYRSVRPVKKGLWLRDPSDDEPRRLVDGSLYDIEDLCFLGEEELFYTGTPGTRAGQNPRYYRCSLESAAVRELPFCDAPVGNGVGTDAKYGGGKKMAFSHGELYLLQTSWGNTRLVAMDGDGRLRTVIDREGAITGFDVSDRTVAVTAMRGNGLAEVYLLDPDSGEEKQLTDCNADYFSARRVQTPERFTYRSRNGFEMEGFVLRPADFQPSGKYPGILAVHGGPKAAFGNVFFHEMQCLAAEGFFVFYTNPRGSEGRGEAFADITEALGSKDYDDLMEFTDEVLGRWPQIDPARLGIGGGSYGGFMTNWAIGHTGRFAAAVSQRSISNYVAKVMYTDIGYHANRLQTGAYPWEDFDKVWGMSPLGCADRVGTPTLFLQSDEDYRCWMADALQMFSAVRRNGTPARLVLFHGENHELSRSGKPQNRVTRLKEMLSWYVKYLKIS